MCVFCKMRQGEIPCNKIYEDDKIFAIYDIAPQAKIHILVIPKVHFASLDEIKKEDEEYINACFLQIPTIAKLGHLENGYRLVINNGKDAGQIVPHFHIHLLGGQTLGEIVNVKKA